jgi:ABC-type bacteriocin/lantibiotic exporter with double-glycine peptidase domain
LLSKLDVRVGHNGSKISGGEKQRIGIARAMFKNPEVLIFDESTNALDKKNEETIFKYLKKIKKNKTIIFITHKADVYGAIADKILLTELFDKTTKVSEVTLQQIIEDYTFNFELKEDEVEN